MPTPVGLVVKNGSNARFITSRVMPLPVSLTATMTYCPGAISAPVCSDIVLVEMAVGGLDGEPAAVRHRVARIDGEIEDRVLELVRIDRRLPQAAGQHGLDRDGLADRAAEQFRHALHQPVDVDRLHLERMLAREGEQALHQRRGALGGLAANWRASRARAPRPSRRRSARSRLPMIAVSRLLKSCAMPPVRRPTASIFCAWRSASSVASRRAISCAQHRVRGGLAPRAAQRHQAQRDHRGGRRKAEDQVARHAGQPGRRMISAVSTPVGDVDVDARQLAEGEDAFLAVERRPAA